MITFDDVTVENRVEHNPNWQDYPYKILTIGGSGSGKKYIT